MKLSPSTEARDVPPEQAETVDVGRCQKRLDPAEGGVAAPGDVRGRRLDGHGVSPGGAAGPAYPRSTRVRALACERVSRRFAGAAAPYARSCLVGLHLAAQVAMAAMILSYA